MKDTTLIQLVNDIKSGKTKAVDAVKYYINNIKEKSYLNAVVEVFDDAIQKAEEIDKRVKNKEPLGRLAGAPIIIKDNMLYKGKKCTCASYFLKDFISPYTATVVDRIIKEDGIILGRANMDEFAMGGSNEKSYYGPCKNAHDSTRVAGGSSGGSACAVAADLCVASLGTDTGGSVRQPSSYNGVFGMKPTYGKNSRYGIVAFASSLDQVGPITKTTMDNALLLSVIAGADEHDDTSLRAPVDNYLSQIKGNINNLKVGYCKQIIEKIKGTPYFSKYKKVLDFLKSQGAHLVEISIENIELALPCYYILAPAEATSNLGRFDGIKYSTRNKDAKNIGQIYNLSRTDGFGKEVKRRIMLGNFVLSSGYFDAYYNKAKALQQNIRESFKTAFSKCDVVLFPTTSDVAFTIGSMNKNPIEMYLIDLFTVPANIAGIPAFSLPFDKGENNLPLGLQILANDNNEGIIYNLADFIEKKYKESK